MDNPNLFTALAYYTVSCFLDPIQWLICGICGWTVERIDHAMIAGAAMVSVLFIVDGPGSIPTGSCSPSRRPTWGSPSWGRRSAPP